MQRRSARALALLLATSSALCEVPVLAQQAPQNQPEDPKREARRKGEEALKLFGADRWEEARRLFREADKLYHAPTLELYAARCERKLGMLLEARATYEHLIAEVLPPNNPKPFLEAQEVAKEELEKLRPRIPIVKIVVKGVEPRSAKVTVDGHAVSVIEGNMTEVNPGNHRIEASVAGANPFVRYFGISEGGTKTIELALSKGASTPSLQPQIEEPVSKGSLVPGGVLLGAGGAGLAVGAVTGILAFNTVSEYRQRCEANHCLPADAEKGDSAKLLGNISTAAFVAGGALAATGVVLLLVRPGGGSTEQAATVRAELGPGSLRLVGSF